MVAPETPGNSQRNSPGPTRNQAGSVRPKKTCCLGKGLLFRRNARVLAGDVNGVVVSAPSVSDAGVASAHHAGVLAVVSTGVVPDVGLGLIAGAAASGADTDTGTGTGTGAGTGPGRVAGVIAGAPSTNNAGVARVEARRLTGLGLLMGAFSDLARAQHRRGNLARGGAAGAGRGGPAAAIARSGRGQRRDGCGHAERGRRRGIGDRGLHGGRGTTNTALQRGRTKSTAAQVPAVTTAGVGSCGTTARQGGKHASDGSSAQNGVASMHDAGVNKRVSDGFSHLAAEAASH